MANKNRQRENYRLRLKRRRKEERRLAERAATTSADAKAQTHPPVKEQPAHG